jgi:MFS family permease
VAAPFLSAFADRFDRLRVLVLSDVSRMVLTAVGGVVVLSGASSLAVYAVVAVSSICGTVYTPAKLAVTPSLAATPEELTAANVVSSTVESASSFVGPALGGFLVAAFGPGPVFLIQAASFAWSAVMVGGISRPAAGDDEEDAGPREPVRPMAAFGLILRDGRLRLVVGLYTLQTLVFGFYTVFAVVIAFQLLDAGAGTLGLLDAAAGVGGLVGAVVAAALVGRRLAAGFALGLVFWSLPFALIGLVPELTAVLVAMAVLGAANTVFDVAGFTLLQRAVPDEVLGRLFGLLAGLTLGSIAIGAAIAPALMDLVGVRTALVLSGASLPLAALLAWPRLRQIEAAAPTHMAEVALLRGVDFLAVLDEATLERLAASTVRIPVSPGEVLIREGDPGDRFYVVASGAFDIAGRDTATVGDYFGEIALLRDIPRTATVTAISEGEVLALDRGPFLQAVAGEAAQLAEPVVAARLARAG